MDITFCAIPILFGWATWFVVAFVGVVIEYEQKSQVWYNHKTWKEYFLRDSLGDLIADFLGIVIGIIIKKILG